jgi:hypothetical protein
MKKIVFAGAALAALTAATAFAQPAPQAGARAPHPMTRAEVQTRVQARFARADVNRDGFVTQDEVQAQRTQRTEKLEARRGERRADRFARLDANRDGVLSRAEFDARAGLRDGARRGVRGEHAGRGHGRFSGRMGGGFGGRAFAALDLNRDGRVSLQEAQARALQAFDRADANRDGTVTPEERRTAREAFRAQRRG